MYRCTDVLNAVAYGFSTLRTDSPRTRARGVLRQLRTDSRRLGCDLYTENKTEILDDNQQTKITGTKITSLLPSSCKAKERSRVVSPMTASFHTKVGIFTPLTSEAQ